MMIKIKSEIRAIIKDLKVKLNINDTLNLNYKYTNHQ